MRKKIRSRAFACLTALFCALCLCACTGEPVPIRLTFVSTVVEVPTVTEDKGTTVNLPQLTDPDGFYTFDGWFSESDCSGKPLTTLRLTADATVYAKWTPISFTVTFDAGGGRYPVDEQTFTCEQPVVPDVPLRAGYTFDGWFDQDGKAFTTTAGVNRDIRVAARWTAELPADCLDFIGNDDGTWTVCLKEGETAPARVTIPYEYKGKTVTAIARDGFAQQASLQQVTMYDNIKTVGDGAFAGTSVRDVDLKGVEHIGSRAFDGCAMTAIALESAVEIDDYAFAGCAALVYVVLGAKTQTVAQSAFFGCPLRSVLSFAATPPVIDVSAFVETDRLHIYVPSASLAQYEGAVGWQKYYNRDQLHDMAVIDGDFAVVSKTVGTGETAETKYKLLQYFGSKTAVVPENVTEIANYAFADTAATNVTLNAVTSIGQFAFSGCDLEKLTILGDKPPVLGTSALEVSDKLKIYVPARAEQEYRAAESWQAFLDCLVFVPDESES